MEKFPVFRFPLRSTQKYVNKRSEGDFEPSPYNFQMDDKAQVG